MFRVDRPGPMSRLEREVMQTIESPGSGVRPSKSRAAARRAVAGPPGIGGLVLPELPRVRRGRRGFLCLTVGLLCWVYAACLLAYWGLIHFTADRWWLGTILMYS